MNVIKLTIKISIILLIISIILSPNCYASTIGETIREGREFLSTGNAISETLNTTELASTSSYIYKTLLAIAIIVSVIIGAILGNQFILASAEGKAKVSEALIPYIIGCFIVFGAFTIWSVVVKIGNSVGKPNEIVIDREDGKPNDNGTLTFEGTDETYQIPAL